MVCWSFLLLSWRAGPSHSIKQINIGSIKVLNFCISLQPFSLDKVFPEQSNMFQMCDHQNHDQVTRPYVDRKCCNIFLPRIEQSFFLSYSQQKEYRKDYEESIKGRNLTGLEVTPALLHVKYATKIASEVWPCWSLLSFLIQIIELTPLTNVFFLPFSPPPNIVSCKLGSSLVLRHNVLSVLILLIFK